MLTPEQIDQWAEAHRGSIADVIAGAMQEATERLRVTGNPNPPDNLPLRVEDALRAMWGDAVRRSGRVMIDEFKDCFPLEMKNDENLFDRLVNLFFETYGRRRVEQIVDATREQMIALLQRGLRMGQTLPQIANAITDAIPQIARSRAAVIARTETHSAAVYASNEVAKTSRRPLLKEWMSTEDYRTRDFGEGDAEVDEFSHRAMDGVRVPLDQPFMVPRRNGAREPLMFPGDPNGSAGNIINCRCVQSYVRADA